MFSSGAVVELRLVRQTPFPLKLLSLGPKGISILAVAVVPVVNRRSVAVAWCRVKISVFLNPGFGFRPRFWI